MSSPIQESPEGQKMLELRKSLPAYKKKDALLKAVSENQVSCNLLLLQLVMDDCFCSPS